MDFEALVKAKFDEAYAATEHPKKFFLTENGRGVVDGGDMYNALLHDVLDVVQRAVVGILKDSHHNHQEMIRYVAAAQLSAAVFLLPFPQIINSLPLFICIQLWYNTRK